MGEWWNGRHASLRNWSRKRWKFESSLAYHWSKNGYNDGYKTVFIDTMGEERSVGSQRFCKIR